MHETWRAGYKPGAVYTKPKSQQGGLALWEGCVGCGCGAALCCEGPEGLLHMAFVVGYQEGKYITGL
jgi:hypothetical protein